MKSVLFPHSRSRSARTEQPSQSRNMRELVARSHQQQRLRAADRCTFRPEEYLLSCTDVAASGASLLSWSNELEERLSFAEARVSEMLRNVNFLQGLEAVVSSSQHLVARALPTPPGPKPPNSGRPARRSPAVARQAWAEASISEFAQASQCGLEMTLAEKLDTLDNIQKEQNAVQACQSDRLEAMRKELDDLISFRSELLSNASSGSEPADGESKQVIQDFLESRHDRASDEQVELLDTPQKQRRKMQNNACTTKRLKEELHTNLEVIIFDRLDKIEEKLRCDIEASIADSVKKSMHVFSQESLCNAPDAALGDKLEILIFERFGGELEANNKCLARLEETCTQAPPENQQFDTINQQLDESSSRLERLEDMCKRAISEIQQFDALKQQLEESSHRLERLEETCKQATPDTQEFDSLKQQLEDSSTRLDRLEESCKQATPENQLFDALKQQLDDSNRRLGRLEETCEQATPDKQQFDMVKQQVEESRQRLDRLEGTCKQAISENEQIDALKQQLEESSHRLGRLEETCERATSDKQQFDTVKQQLADSSSRLDRLEGTCKQAISENEQIDALKQQLEESSHRLGRLEETCERATSDKQQFDTVKQQLADSSSRLDRLEETCKQVGATQAIGEGKSSREPDFQSDANKEADALGRSEHAIDEKSLRDVALASVHSGDVLAQDESKLIFSESNAPDAAVGLAPELVTGEAAQADGTYVAADPLLPQVTFKVEAVEAAPEVFSETAVRDDANSAKDNAPAVAQEPSFDLALKSERKSIEDAQDESQSLPDGIPRPQFDSDLENKQEQITQRASTDPAIEAEKMEEGIAQDDRGTMTAAVVEENPPQAGVGPSAAEEIITQGHSINASAGEPLHEGNFIQDDGISASTGQETAHAQGDRIGNVSLSANSKNSATKPHAFSESDGSRGDIQHYETVAVDCEKLLPQAGLGAHVAEGSARDGGKSVPPAESVPQSPPE
eukprot:TRINITY_DN2148_c0_g1_i3.p1 TRINITY_DN2148_c0_g1~~TRINITY_DN2148_c0_g1_i3.p1  ORF type:complete len:973 (+),score=211.20 TRINITY_DN2148_c0_g1_i3:51-2969(+)